MSYSTRSGRAITRKRHFNETQTIPEQKKQQKKQKSAPKAPPKARPTVNALTEAPDLTN